MDWVWSHLTQRSRFSPNDPVIGRVVQRSAFANAFVAVELWVLQVKLDQRSLLLER